MEKYDRSEMFLLATSCLTLVLTAAVVLVMVV